MGIKVIWDNEQKTVLRYEFDGRWHWIDFQQATKYAATLLDTVDHSVGVIIDLTHSQAVPEQPLSNIKTALGNPRHDKVGLTVVVGASLFLTALADSARRIYKSVSGNYDIDLARSLDEARTILARHAAFTASVAGKKHE